MKAKRITIKKECPHCGRKTDVPERYPVARIICYKCGTIYIYCKTALGRIVLEST